MHTKPKAQNRKHKTQLTEPNWAQSKQTEAIIDNCQNQIST